MKKDVKVIRNVKVEQDPYMNAVNQMEAIGIVKSWQGHIRTYAAVEEFMKYRQQAAIRIGSDPENDEALISGIKYAETQIKKILGFIS